MGKILWNAVHSGLQGCLQVLALCAGFLCLRRSEFVVIIRFLSNFVKWEAQRTCYNHNNKNRTSSCQESFHLLHALLPSLSFRSDLVSRKDGSLIITPTFRPHLFTHMGRRGPFLFFINFVSQETCSQRSWMVPDVFPSIDYWWIWTCITRCQV